MTADISFDLVMDEDMDFVEGTYRIKDDEWQVFIISKTPFDAAPPKSTEWSSGVTGVTIKLPLSFRLNKEAVMKMLSRWLGVDTWNEVHGPDSMRLR